MRRAHRSDTTAFKIAVNSDALTDSDGVDAAANTATATTNTMNADRSDEVAYPNNNNNNGTPASKAAATSAAPARTAAAAAAMNS